MWILYGGKKGADVKIPTNQFFKSSYRQASLWKWREAVSVIIHYCMSEYGQYTVSSISTSVFLYLSLGLTIYENETFSQNYSKSLALLSWYRVRKVATSVLQKHLGKIVSQHGIENYLFPSMSK